MAINKIIKLGLEEEANKLKAQGLSDYKIAEELTKIAGIKSPDRQSTAILIRTMIQSSSMLSSVKKSSLRPSMAG